MLLTKIISLRISEKRTGFGIPTKVKAAIQAVTTGSWRPVVPVQKGLLARLHACLLDRSSVPKDFPIVRVVDGGLALPESSKLILEDNTLVTSLQRQGIEYLTGESLTSKTFLRRLQEVAQDGDTEEVNSFLRIHLVYPMSLSSIEPRAELIEEAHQEINTLLEPLAQQYPRTMEALAPIIASISQKIHAMGLAHSERPAVGLFYTSLRQSGGSIAASFINARNYLLNKNIPLTKLIVFLYQLNRIMEQILARTNGDQKALYTFLRYLNHELLLYSSQEAVGYAFDQLLAQWHTLSDPSNAEVFFCFGLKIVLEGGVWLPYESVYTIENIAANHTTVDKNLTENEFWISLLELLSLRELTFGSTKYTILKVEPLANNVEIGDSEGKNPIFKIHLIDTSGKEQQILAKWTERKNAIYDQIATSVSCLLGLPSYHTQVYKCNTVQSEEYVWEFIEYIPNRLVAFTSLLYGFTIDGINHVLEGEPHEIANRLHSLGAILALEYVFRASDCSMKHIRLSRDNKLFFRIDWEYLFDDLGAYKFDAPTVMQGDEETFLKSLIGHTNTAPVITGFRETIEKARRKQDQILAIIRDNLPKDKHDHARQHLLTRLAVPTDAIIGELGLI